ncbi:peptidoglycan recognition family protein [Actinomadura welshii]
MIAHSGEGADGRQPCGAPVTRRALIGGVVGAGLLSVGSSVHDGVMADERPAGPDLRVGDHVAFRADTPHVYTRAQWDARSPRRPAKVLDRPPDHIIVHHTATANSDKRSLSHAFALSRFIQNFHMDKNGWDDTGQQLTISRGGIVMEGRNRSLQAIRAGDLAVGAQVLHHNDHTIGIENEGTYTKKRVPGQLWDSLVEVCVWLCRSYDLDPAEAIVGHRDYNATACPGDVLYARLPELRKSVASRLEGSGSSSGSAGGPPSSSIFPSFDGFG